MSGEQETLVPNAVAPTAEQPEAASMAQPRAGLLALVEALDRHGNVQARLPVSGWPVTVGRDLRADLVLDDPHVAGEHMELSSGSPGKVTVRVLDTGNGVTLGGKHYARGASFDWPAGQPLLVGRQHLRLRLADTPVAAELLLPQGGPWRTTLWSLASLAVALLIMIGQGWLKSTDTQRLAQELPMVLVGALAGLVAWAGLWALATKLFSGQAQFWRHVRIASLAFVVSEVLEFAVQILAFSFSLESVSRFSYLLLVVVAAFGIYRHLLVVAPQPRRGLAIGVALVVMLGLPVVLGTQWLKNKRLSNQLYMSKLFPPAWRVAQPVPVAEFLKEAGSIEQRLAKRLQDKQDEDAADPPEDE